MITNNSQVTDVLTAARLGPQPRSPIIYAITLIKLDAGKLCTDNWSLFTSVETDQFILVASTSILTV